MVTNWALTGDRVPGSELDDLLRRLALIASAVQRDGRRRELAVAGLRFAVEPAPATLAPAGCVDVDAPGGALLTERERDVASLVCFGFQNLEIARRLGIAENTVKRHLYNIYNKTGVDTRTQLANQLRSRAG